MRPDVPALDRELDYLVPHGLGELPVGTIVRIPLHGRRVRGWVTADDVVPQDRRLLPLAGVVGAGPPPAVVELARWAAWRYAGPLTAFLRAASPPNVVPLEGVSAPPPSPAELKASATPEPRLVVWPPAADRRDLVAGLVAAEGSTIIVVPAGARLGSLVHRLEGAGARVLRQQASVSDAQRSDAWARARDGRCVVVGGRLAIWAPVPDLGAVVVLDDGAEGLAEEAAPTWSAVAVGQERARRAGAALIRVSPVPSPEAEAAVQVVERPPRNVERDGWPLLDVVDLRAQPPGAGLLSDPLAAALQRALESGGRAVVVVNRTGRARLLACAACRETALCEVCGAAVAEQRVGPEGGRELRCPRCGTTRPFVCAHCHSSRLGARRVGVTRLRDDVAALLPRARVAEVTGARVRGARKESADHVEAVSRIEVEQDAATDTEHAVVLVGTEAVLHRVPRGAPVRLVAYPEIDQELFAPRYRAAELALWLLVRGARLLGPRSRSGRLLVQTRTPEHEVLEAVRRADPTPVAAAERARREVLGYPPFGALAELSGVVEAVEAAAEAVRRAGPDVLGPVVATPGTARALVRADTHAALADALAVGAPVGRARGRLRVAVDPPRV